MSLNHILFGLVRRTRFLYSDVLYLRLLYYFKMGRVLHLKNPKTFTEKIQWLKLYNRRPEYSQMVDKYAVKKYVADRIGEEYVIPLLGVWEKPEDIKWDSLPNQFVLKTTNGGGSNGVIICRDKSTFNRNDTICKLREALKSNIYRQWGEWPYKNVVPRIIAEKYLNPDSQLNDVPDYKFFCFNGEPKIIQLDFDRFNGHKKNLYSAEWELLPFSFNFPSHPEINFDKPDRLGEMLDIVKKISKDMIFSRVDLYWVSGKVYFGEITFYPASGMGQFTPQIYDEILGEMLELPNNCKN